MACRNANDRTAERRTLSCGACGDSFTTVADHGVWPKFCSRACFLGECKESKHKECAACGGVFLATSSSHETEDGLRKYCSKKCHTEGITTASEYQCLNCSKPFLLAPSTLRQRGMAGCCSRNCQTEFYQGELSSNYKGGVYVDSNSGDTRVLAKRPGYAGKYMGQHQVVASQSIGRLVSRGEVVIRINRNPKDNRPENLFICESMSEFAKRRSGSMPWPNQSNLSTYAAP
jgi:hypothetical protein